MADDGLPFERLVPEARAVKPVAVLMGGTAMGGAREGSVPHVLAMECWSKQLDVRTALVADLAGVPHIIGVGAVTSIVVRPAPGWVRAIFGLETRTTGWMRLHEPSR